MKTRTWLIAAGVILAAVLSGCGGGGSSSRSGAAVTDVQGAAVKGILKFADVTAYALVDGAVEASPLASTSTDASGRYRLKATHRGPVLIRISGNSDARMVCDLPAGCDDGAGGTADFGEEVPFGSDMALEAVTVLEGRGTSVNVTPLTHLAAAKARAAGLSEAAVLLANSHLANLFDLSDDLVALPVIDITDSGALERATATAQRAALLAAALYGAAVEEGQTLDELAMAFLNDAGQFRGESALPGVDLASIYRIAQDARSASGADLPAIATGFDTALAAAEQLGDSFTTAAPSDSATLAALDKAKALVAQVRTIGTSFISEQGVQQFIDELDAAATLVSDDVERLAEALGYAMEAIMLVYGELQAGAGEEGQIESPVVIPMGAVEVELTIDGDVVTVTRISGLGDDLTIALTTTLKSEFGCDCDALDVEDGYASSDQGSLELGLQGSLGVPALTLNIAEGSASFAARVDVAGNWHEEDLPNGDYSFEDFYEQSIQGAVDFVLHARLAQTDETTGVELPFGAALEGRLELSLTGFQAESRNHYEELCGDERCEETELDEELLTFGLARVAFLGAVDSGSNEVALNFAFEADGKGLTQREWRKYQERWCYSGPCDYEYHDSGWQDEPLEETASRFVEGSFSLVLQINLDGIAEASRIELAGSRQALTTGDVALKISYPGKQLLINAPLEAAEQGGISPPLVTVTNQDGVIATLWVDERGETRGDIRVAGVVYATITEPNVIKITYADGTFESLQ